MCIYIVSRDGAGLFYSDDDPSRCVAPQRMPVKGRARAATLGPIWVATAGAMAEKIL